MRKIEKMMLQAANNNVKFSMGNTTVKPIDDNNCAIFLHGNHIADYNSNTGFVMVNKTTLQKWPSNTTKSRLCALGVNVYTLKGNTYINGESIYN